MDNKNYLAHHGVKGMRWGVRKDRRSSGSSRSSRSSRKGTKKPRAKLTKKQKIGIGVGATAATLTIVGSVAVASSPKARAVLKQHGKNISSIAKNGRNSIVKAFKNSPEKMNDAFHEAVANHKATKDLHKQARNAVRMDNKDLNSFQDRLNKIENVRKKEDNLHPGKKFVKDALYKVAAPAAAGGLAYAMAHQTRKKGNKEESVNYDELARYAFPNPNKKKK